MPTITEGNLLFTFPATWSVSKVDEWSFYRNQFQSVCGGTKAIDILAIVGECCWQIEIKDYRQHPRTKVIDLAEEIALKVKDSLSLLVAAACNANDKTEKEMAHTAVNCTRLRVVLHLEQPAKHSKLFPMAIDPAKVQQRLRQLLKAIDPHPLVMDKSRMDTVLWTVRENNG